MIGLTVTVNVAVAAHCPAFGVNVYTPELELLIVAGLHKPVIPLEDVFDNDGTVPPEHIVSDVPKTNVGVTIALTVTVNVTGSAH